MSRLPFEISPLSSFIVFINLQRCQKYSVDKENKLVCSKERERDKERERGRTQEEDGAKEKVAASA